MQVCAALYYLMRDTGARTVTADLLSVAYEQAMRELERPFALHWGELGTHKYLQQVTKRIAHRAVLYAAEGDGATVPRPEVLRALRALEERGLVVRLGRGRYDFVEPMFGEYVRRLDEAVLVAAIVPKRWSGCDPGSRSATSPWPPHTGLGARAVAPPPTAR